MRGLESARLARAVNHSTVLRAVAWQAQTSGNENSSRCSPQIKCHAYRASSPEVACGRPRNGGKLLTVSSLFIGCAGWSLPREQQALFPTDGTHLQRFASRFPAVEINSSFYRPHRTATYARWAGDVPPDFRFAVKLPKTITHVAKLVETTALLETFLAEVGGLGTKLGVLLVQLPPSLRFDQRRVSRFFTDLRERHAGAVVCEPRHLTWFAPEADGLLRQMRVARCAADPAPVPAAALPGGCETERVYYRLHGSPKCIIPLTAKSSSSTWPPN